MTEPEALAQAPQVRQRYRRMLERRGRLNAPVQTEERRREDFYDFFVVAYHLADWIKSGGVLDQQVRDAAWALRHKGNIGLAGVLGGLRAVPGGVRAGQEGHRGRGRDREVDGVGLPAE
jgi:hypothetical protein